jgi:hypothetical protein
MSLAGNPRAAQASHVKAGMVGALLKARSPDSGQDLHRPDELTRAAQQDLQDPPSVGVSRSVSPRPSDCVPGASAPASAGRQALPGAGGERVPPTMLLAKEDRPGGGVRLRQDPGDRRCEGEARLGRQLRSDSQPLFATARRGYARVLGEPGSLVGAMFVMEVSRLVRQEDDDDGKRTCWCFTGRRYRRAPVGCCCCSAELALATRSAFPRRGRAADHHLVAGRRGSSAGYLGVRAAGRRACAAGGSRGVRARSGLPACCSGRGAGPGRGYCGGVVSYRPVFRPGVGGPGCRCCQAVA